MHVYRVMSEALLLLGKGALQRDTEQSMTRSVITFLVLKSHGPTHIWRMCVHVLTMHVLPTQLDRQDNGEGESPPKSGGGPPSKLRAYKDNNNSGKLVTSMTAVVREPAPYGY